MCRSLGIFISRLYARVRKLDSLQETTPKRLIPHSYTQFISKEKVEKRSRCMKPFVKYVNVRHVFPTRYVVDLDLKKAAEGADLNKADQKIEVQKNLKKLFEDRYLNQKEVTSEKKAAGSAYFFQKLKF